VVIILIAKRRALIVRIGERSEAACGIDVAWNESAENGCMAGGTPEVIVCDSFIDGIDGAVGYAAEFVVSVLDEIVISGTVHTGELARAKRWRDGDRVVSITG